MEDSDFTLEERVLCSDGACIGLIGPDGRCKECGAAYTGGEPLPGQGDAGPSTDTAVDPPPVEAPEVADEVDGDSPERECCADDMCVGIIGPDGTCGTCGKQR